MKTIEEVIKDFGFSKETNIENFDGLYEEYINPFYMIKHFWDEEGSNWFLCNLDGTYASTIFELKAIEDFQSWYDYLNK